MKRLGQAWGFDLLIASVIFLSGILFFFLFVLNNGSSSGNLSDLFYDAESVSDSLLSEGSPVSWDSDNVVRVGLVSDSKVNQTKINEMYELASTSEGYAKLQRMFNVNRNFFFNFSEQMSVDGVGNVDGIGKIYWDKETKNVIKITRFTSYNNKPISLNVFVWE